MKTSTLGQTIKKALAAGGDQMSLEKKRKLFGCNTRLERNVMHICSEPTLGQAVAAGVVTDHRTAEALHKVAPVVRAMILRVEARLGRKLGRERASALAAAYQRVRQERREHDTVCRFLEGFREMANRPEAAMAFA